MKIKESASNGYNAPFLAVKYVEPRKVLCLSGDFGGVTGDNGDDDDIEDGLDF